MKIGDKFTYGGDEWAVVYFTPPSPFGIVKLTNERNTCSIETTPEWVDQYMTPFVPPFKVGDIIASGDGMVRLDIDLIVNGELSNEC